MTVELGSLKFGRTSRCKPAKFIKIWNSFQTTWWKPNHR